MIFKKFLFIFLGIYGIYFIVPYFIDIHIKQIPFSTLVYDENDIELGEIISDKKYRHIEKNITQFPDFLKKSLIAIEDRRFYYHSGIDYIGITRAIKNNIFGGNTQGASTIETQIIRNNYWLNEKRSIGLKGKEFIFALSLNKKYSKDKILEMYINSVNFGYLNYGFESASRFYYNKSVSYLTHAEIIGLITIIKNPNKYNPINNISQFNLRFKNLVSYLKTNNIISESEKNEILSEKLTFKKGKTDISPYIVDFLKKDIQTLSGSIVHTTIDYNMTNVIDNLAKNSIKTLSWKNVSDYSILIIEKETMNLKVMIGGYDYYATEGQVNSSLALRQPGSTLKPFIYALIFQIFNKVPGSTILDLPVSYPTADGNIYEPKNYSLNFSGEVTLAEALSQSINIPAVKLLNEIGINKFMLFLRSIGIHSLDKSSDFYGLSLALGSGEISLYELTRAYSIFAQKGKYCDINIMSNDTKKCKKIMDEKYTNMVEEILTNRYFKLAGFPINSNLDFPDREVFVKTGTSRNFRDNWSIGYTNKYIIGVWVGNKNGSEMLGVSGASGAGDIFRKIVYNLDNTDSNSKIISLDKDSLSYIKIISPLNNSIYEMNDSIPLKNQKIKLNFSSNLVYDKIVWYIDNKIFEGDFLGIETIGNNMFIEVQAFKNGILIGSDSVFINKK